MKYNKPETIKEKVENMEGATLNHEGSLVYNHDDKTTLLKMVSTSLVGEQKFYMDGDSHDMEIIKLTQKVSLQDPYFILNLAVYAREILKLRSIPLMLLAEFANTTHVPYSRQYVTRTIQRVDEITELIAYQLQRNKVIPRTTKLPMMLKNGVGEAFNKFDEYQFAKYNRKGLVSLKDALFLTHPKPKDNAQQKIFNKIIEDKLETPETWETYISANGSSKESWSYIAPKLPIFALIQNLRNLIKYDVPIEFYEQKLRNHEIIQKSRLLPFRFYSAYKAIQETDGFQKRNVMTALEDAMELSVGNIEKLDGKTAIFVDVSGSMTASISRNSNVSYMEIARLFGAISDKIFPESIIGVFGQKFAEINTSKRASILSKMKDITNCGVGHSTNGYLAVQWLLEKGIRVDRIIIFSDEQLWNSNSYFGRQDGVTVQSEIEKYRRQVNPKVFVHSIDLAGYSQSIVAPGDNRANLISGWSERILDNVGLFEKGMGNMIDEINRFVPHP